MTMHAPPPLPSADGEAPPAPAQAIVPASDEAPPRGQANCLRQTPRQATSAVAHVAPLPEEDDPLLAFEPYLHEAPRGNSITPDLQRRFIATLAATGIVNQAARSIGKSMEALYRLRHQPGAEGFSAAWDAALARGVHRLEDCALERALEGVATPIVSGGKVLGVWHKPDNGLLRFLLQQRRSVDPGSGTPGPGHPVYDAIRAELEAEFAAREAERVREEEACERARIERERERELEEIEWEEEQARLAEQEEAAKTPEQRQREGLLYKLNRWSLEDLVAKVDW